MVNFVSLACILGMLVCFCFVGESPALVFCGVFGLMLAPIFVVGVVVHSSVVRHCCSNLAYVCFCSGFGFTWLDVHSSMIQY